MIKNPLLISRVLTTSLPSIPNIAWSRIVLPHSPPADIQEVIHAAVGLVPGENLQLIINLYPRMLANSLRRLFIESVREDIIDEQLDKALREILNSCLPWN